MDWYQQEKGSPPIFVSFLIPAYNSERYIGQCLESIVTQGISDYEVIVVDDGSIDSTGAIADGFAKQYSSVKVLHKQNEGVLAARIDACKSARGKYVLSVDSDDWLFPGTLMPLFSFLKRTNADIVQYGYATVCGSDVRRADDSAARTAIESGSKVAVINEFFHTKNLNNACFKAIRRSLLDLRSISDAQGVSMGDDWFFSFSAMLSARAYRYFDCCVYAYRKRKMSLTCLYDYQYWESLVLMHRYRIGAIETDSAGLGQSDSCLLELRELSCITLLNELAKAIAYIPAMPDNRRTYRHMLGRIRQDEIVDSVLRESVGNVSPVFRIPLRLMVSGHGNLLWVMKGLSSILRKGVCLNGAC